MPDKNLPQTRDGRRWGAWSWNLVLDTIDWVTLTSGIGFREFRSLGADDRLAGRNYFREAKAA